MNKPTDYPVEASLSDANNEQPDGNYTMAMLRERIAAKQPVTDEMIRVARAKIDSAHPTASKPGMTSTGKSRIGRFRQRFK